ncbi:hypothetical protein LINPERHAP1_LOCUS38195, partial [Linum perenne]
ESAIVINTTPNFVRLASDFIDRRFDEDRDLQKERSPGGVSGYLALIMKLP